MVGIGVFRAAYRIKTAGQCPIQSAMGFEPRNAAELLLELAPCQPTYGANLQVRAKLRAPCRIRTDDPRFTRAVLWPTELRRRAPADRDWMPRRTGAGARER
jgi:hypothetical protein